MTDHDDSIGDGEIRDWLLQRLDAQRSAVIEQQLFDEMGLADRIDAIECDLFDDAVHGRLPAADASIVRMRDAWRLRFAKAFAELQRPAAMPAPQRRMSTQRRVGFGLAIAASLSLAVVAISWNAIVRVPAERAARSASLPVVTLLVEQSRGAATPLKLPAHDGDVRVQAEIADDSTEASAHYTFSVADGARVLFQVSDLATHTVGPYRFVEVAVPATVLRPGMRRITVAEEGAQRSSATTWDVEMPTSR